MATRLIPCLLAVFLATAFASAATAGLAWEEKKVDLRADAQTPVLEAHFHFVNTGASAVDILKVESSCGCTTTALARNHYEPGEKGEIIARLKVGDHVGVLAKTVEVITNDGSDPTTLTLLATIPEVLRIRPAFVHWNQGDPPDAKTISLELLQDSPITGIEIGSSNSAAMTTELKPLVKGRKYELVITPAGTKKFLFATLTLDCHFGEQEKTFRVYAAVKAANQRVAE